jgi:hypothetical protein
MQRNKEAGRPLARDAHLRPAVDYKLVGFRERVLGGW